MTISIISLLFGLIIGYMAQRSRMCFIGGIRDFVLVRDTYLLKGMLAFLITAAIMFYVSYHAGGNLYGYPWYKRTKEVLELARDFYIYSACGIPDEVLLAVQEIEKIKGVTLPGGYTVSYVAIFTVLSGLGIGYLSTVANGCPLRQHVLASSGNRTAYMYLAGFYIGAVVFTYLIAPLLRGMGL